VTNPKATFQVAGDLDSNYTVVNYTSYGCVMCKEMHKITSEALKIRDDVRFVARPILLGNDKADKLVKLALAAGLQGKFWEIHNALMEYPEFEIPDLFVEETSLLYGLNYNKMLEDAEGAEVAKIAKDNLRSMRRVGVDYMPSFVINRNVVHVNQKPELRDFLQLLKESQY
jgi:protein-disulfide isomerase